MYKRYRKGIVCVIYVLRPLRYLLLHRKLHWTGWEILKGGSLAREKIMNTVKREIMEETGLTPISCKRFPIRGSFVYDKKTQRERKAKGFSYQLFACLVKRDKIRIYEKKEHDGYRWCSYKEAMKLLTWPNQKKHLRIVNSFIKNRR